MKQLAIYMVLAAAAFWAGACSTNNKDRTVDSAALEWRAPGTGGPEFTFKDTLFNTGRIAQGEVVETKFEFTNTGDEPLIIASVSGSCGCTIPRSYPKQKIWPGEGGVIDVIFDSDNKWGEQTIVISISANTVPSRTELVILTDIAAPNNLKN